MRQWRARNGDRYGLSGFLGTVFFIFLTDAILSSWVPGFVQGIVKKPLWMGLIVSFSSIVGLVMDFIFSEILEGKKVKKLIWWSILGCFSFIVWLWLGLKFQWIWLLLLAMASWGFYYDLFNFFSQQFVAERVERPMRASVWGVVGFVRNLAYFAGPILAANLMEKGNELVIQVGVLLLILAGLGVSFWFREGRGEKNSFSHKKAGFKVELEHWLVLWNRVWPLLLMSLVLNLIDATYWTTGTIVTEKLARESWWGSLFLPFYILPSLFVGGILMKWRVMEGKKKMALKFLMGAGLLLAGLELRSSLGWKLGIILGSSTLLAVSWPLVNAVYTDLIERMGRERETLLGLSDSMMNIAYIVGPILAGLIAQVVGEERTFVVIGWGAMGISLFLRWVMPRKLRLPQREMREWGG